MAEKSLKIFDLWKNDKDIPTRSAEHFSKLSERTDNEIIIVKLIVCTDSGFFCIRYKLAYSVFTQHQRSCEVHINLDT